MGMFLESKLKRWVDAKVIDESTHSAILEYESKGSTTSVLTAALAIGALAIIVGIISIIAANWYDIPKYFKLASNALWLLGLVIGISYSFKKQMKFASEALILILFGSILGSLGLVGQIYHLESDMFITISTWLVLGTPVLFLSKTKYPAIAWSIVVIIWASHSLSYFFPAHFKEMHSLIGLVPLIVFYASILTGLLKLENQYFSSFCMQFGSILLMGIAVLLGPWRWASITSDGNHIEAISIFCASLPIAFYVSNKFLKMAGVILLLAIGYLEIPNFFFHDQLKLVGALLFILIWGLIGYTGVTIKLKKLFDLSCMMIALRIIFVYFEIFGTLLQTGIGLISSGAFILFVAYLWHTKKDKIWSLRGKS
jgi:uncharacterized membrane protein